MLPVHIHIAGEGQDLQGDLGDALTREGFHVSSFRSGYPVVEMMDNWPDLFIIDIALPGINGIETCKWLKAHEDSCYVPVLLVAGEHYLKILAASAHPDDFLDAPINIERAMEKIKDLLVAAKA